MRLSIYFIIGVYAFGAVCGISVWRWINPPAEPIEIIASDTLTVVKYETVPGDTIYVKVPFRVIEKDTIFVIRVDTIRIDSIQYAEIDTVYEDLPISVRYDFPPVSTFTLRFGEWLRPTEIITIREQVIVPAKWAYDVGIYAGSDDGFSMGAALGAVYRQRWRTALFLSPEATMVGLGIIIN